MKRHPALDAAESRRNFLTGLAALGASTFLPGCATEGGTQAGKPFRIDVHHHYIPPNYLSSIPRARGGGKPPVWTPQLSLEDMDKNGIATSMASIIPDGVWFNDIPLSRKLARLVNDYAAQLARDYPGRYGVFASIAYRHGASVGVLLAVRGAIFLVLALFLFATRGLKEIPRGLQNFVEWAYETLEDFGTSIGGPEARKYIPVYASFFLLILFSNWSGLVPPVGKMEELRAPTSDVNVTIGLALAAFAYFEFQGFRANGLGYLKKFFPVYEFKSGIGAGLIAMFVGLIELLLEFVKPVTLAMRLFGNIYGGEVALGVMTALIIGVIPVALYFLEAILNSSFDWNGIRAPHLVATENDSLNGSTMLLLYLLTNRAQIFADVRTYWSPDAVQRVTGHRLTGVAKDGVIHLINSGAATLDATGAMTNAAGEPAMKPFWEIGQADDVVDKLYEAIKLYLIQVSRNDLSEDEGKRYIEILSFTTNLEHIGDIIDKHPEKALSIIRTWLYQEA